MFPAAPIYFPLIQNTYRSTRTINQEHPNLSYPQFSKSQLTTEQVGVVNPLVTYSTSREFKVGIVQMIEILSLWDGFINQYEWIHHPELYGYTTSYFFFFIQKKIYIYKSQLEPKYWYINLVHVCTHVSFGLFIWNSTICKW